MKDVIALDIDRIKSLRAKRKQELIAVFQQLSQLQQMGSEAEKQRLVHNLTIRKNEVEKKYFSEITTLLVHNRNALRQEIEKLKVAGSSVLEAEQKLKANDEQARFFEAEILQEKLLLSKQLRLSPAEVEQIRARLHSLGFEVSN